MSQASGTFHCPACAAAFAWKPHYAGRKTRCKCGEVFVPAGPQAAPAPAPAPGPNPLDEDYAVGEELAPAPATRTAVAPRPQPPPQPPPQQPVYDDPGVVPASVAALYGRRPGRYAAEAVDSDTEDGTPVKTLYIPLAMLGVGLAMRVTQLVYANANRAAKWAATGDAAVRPGRAILLALCETVIAAFIMACGAFVAAMLLNINFGSVGKAALKLAGIAIFATGVAGWVAVFDQGRHSVAGLAIALHLVVIIYWLAVGYLFSLELQETLLTVAIISLLQAAVMCVLWKA